MDWRIFLSFFVQIAVDVMSALIVVQVLMSWFTGSGNKFYDLVESLVSPLLTPIKKLFPSIAGLDLSPMIAIILLEVLRNLILQILN
jgi:YggT family protein